ncbi:GH25 family lysozyme [Kutzneria sp. NPDC051319]|uniref:GH25 family lysozyme n=1 Tax=Kutzneria sp. NPDC051319 TaxID=3155047 RepID=UPI003416C48A
MTEYGTDISSHQGSAIDWPAVKGNGISFVSVKLTEDVDYTNPDAQSQVDGARGVGLTVGGYHFARPGSIVDQANRFADQLSARGLLTAGSLWPMLDMEDGNIGDANAFIDGFIAALRARVGAVGVLMYANLDWYQHRLTPDRWADDQVRLWCAEWNGDPGNVDYGHPKLVIHQHTDKGTIPGITGWVDRDATVPGAQLSTVVIDGTIPTPPTDPTPPPADPAWVPYTIRAGDTLSGIAARFGSSVAELAAHNNIGNPNLIYAGQTIQVPGNSGTGGGGAMYQIQPGDTLSALALRWGTTVAAIATLNGIPDPDRIRAGVWIRRP